MRLNHKHLIVNAVVTKPPGAGDEEKVAGWLRRLIAAIDMKIVIGPHVHYCTAEGNNGITASVNIETSHCSFHCWEKTEPPILRFDLYSCSDFGTPAVLEFIDEFGPVEIDWVVLDRNETKLPAVGSE